MNSRLYISAFQLEDNGVSKRGLALVARLRAVGFHTYMPLQWRDYDVIEGEIDKHDAVVALVETYWWSSTWKLSEVTYALDGIGANHVSEAHVSLPTFLYPLDDALERGFSMTRNRPVLLSPSADEAVSQIQSHLLAVAK